MIKRINIEELNPGMYVVDVAGTWNRFLSTDKKACFADKSFIQLLQKSGYNHVFIDTLRTKRPETAAPPLLKAIDQEADLGQQLKQSLAIQKEARNVVNKIITDVQYGKKLILNEAEDVVAKVADSILQNKFVLSGLSVMKQKNRYLLEHPVSSSVLMIAFAHTYGFDVKKQYELGHGAMLYDIGMINIPSKILNLPGKLSQKQTDILRKHVDYGFSILQNQPDVLKSTLLMVKEHHERLNGSGYPKALTDNEISLYGKMVSIIDVYDASTSDKGYKKGLLPTIALSEIFFKNKRKFDNTLVNIFIKSIGIYPFGTLVKLVNGLIGIVIRIDPEQILYPEIRVIIDPVKGGRVSPYKCNLLKYKHEPLFKIESAIPKSIIPLRDEDIIKIITYA